MSKLWSQIELMKLRHGILSSYQGRYFHKKLIL